MNTSHFCLRVLVITHTFARLSHHLDVFNPGKRKETTHRPIEHPQATWRRTLDVDSLLDPLVEGK